MEITKEAVVKQVEAMNSNVEGYRQGFVTAMSWVVSTLEAKEPKLKESEVAGPEAAR